jgi:hydroxyacylglutathione hydrolase
MLLRQLFDPYLAQYAYLIGCQRTGEAILIDPERDIARYQAEAAANGLRITAVAETHIHADYVSGAAEFAALPEVRLYLPGEGGPDWSYQWPGGRAHTHYLQHGDVFHVGNIRFEALHTPGHTPEHVSFLMTDEGGGANEPMALATGDFVFVGDVGRPDLLESAAGQVGAMEPSAWALQKSLSERLRQLPDHLQILPGHGAGSACGKALGAVPTSTLGYERKFNQPLRQALQNPTAFVAEILRGQPEPPPYFALMKRVNRDGIRVTGEVPQIQPLGLPEARALASQPDLRILDTREDRAEFARCHVPRAVQVPLRGPFFSAGAGSYTAEGQPILVVAPDQSSADLAMLQLYRIGLDAVVGWISFEEWTKAGGPSQQAERIDFAEFSPEAARQAGLILDVRSSLEFSAGHLEGAISIPYTRLRVRLHELPKDRKLFVHCGTGKRAALAASFLRAEGFQAVHVDGVCAECDRIASRQGITH